MDGPSAAASRGIFISYRREDTAYPAGWLFDRLSARFDRSQIFKDIDSIEPGDDFVETINGAVASCDVLLALIGDQWLTMTDADGQRRLDDPADFVRLEIEAALSRNVRVIPVLVEGARMPRADELPPSLVNLVRRQAVELSPSHFATDVDRLLRVLDRTLEEAVSGRGPASPGPERASVTSVSDEASSAEPIRDRLRHLVTTNRRIVRAVVICMAVIVLVAIAVLTVGRLSGPNDGQDEPAPTGEEEPAPTEEEPPPSEGEESPPSDEGAWPVRPSSVTRGRIVIRRGSS